MRLARGPVAAGAMVLAATLVWAASTQAEADTGLEAIGQERVVVPAPGHSREWSMTVRNRDSQPMDVVFSLKAVAGSVFDGPAPATLDIRLGDRQLLAPTSAEHAADARLPLGTLGAGEALTLVGRVNLPASAGDEYRGAVGEIDWRFVGRHEGEAPGAGGATAGDEDRRAQAGGASGSKGGRAAGGRLAFTGTSALTIAAIGAAALALGAVVRRRRRDGGEA